LAGAALWGTTGTAQALAPEGAQPLAVGALRMLVAAAALLAWARLRRKPTPGAPPRSGGRPPFRALLLAAGCMAAYQVFFFAGVRLAGVAVGTLVGIGSAPITAGVLGYLFRGERPGRRWAGATLLAMVGLLLLALGQGQAAGEAAGQVGLGLLLAVGAGAVYAAFSLVSKDLLERHPVEQVMAAVFGLGALMLAPLLAGLLALGHSLAWLADPRGALAVLHLGVLATALAYILFGLGLRRTPLAHAVTLSLAEPLTAGLLGVLLLGEPVSLAGGLGIALIFAGLATLSVR
jgi:DME family drug/metabolite transporter